MEEVKFQSLDDMAHTNLVFLVRKVVHKAYKIMLANPRCTKHVEYLDLMPEEKCRLDSVCSEVKNDILDWENPPNLSFDIRAVEYTRMVSINEHVKYVGVSVYYNPNFMK